MGFKSDKQRKGFFGNRSGNNVPNRLPKSVRDKVKSKTKVPALGEDPIGALTTDPFTAIFGQSWVSDDDDDD